MPATAACLPVPLGLHIDAAAKSKIWSNQFVDFSIYFLHKRPNLSKFNLKKKKKKRKIPSKQFICCRILVIYKQEISEMSGGICS